MLISVIIDRYYHIPTMMPIFVYLLSWCRVLRVIHSLYPPPKRSCGTLTPLMHTESASMAIAARSSSRRLSFQTNNLLSHSQCHIRQSWCVNRRAGRALTCPIRAVPPVWPASASREMVGRRVVLCVKRTRYFRLHHSLKPKKKNTIVIFLLHYSAEIASLCKAQTLSSYHEKVRVGRCYSSRGNCLWHFRGVSEPDIFHPVPYIL